MSSLRKITFAIASVALALPTVASAADLPEYVPPPIDVPSSGGWYLRGDIGFKVYHAPNASTQYNSIGNFYDESMDSTWMAGVGAGYYWNDWFRTDITLDYEGKAGFSGRAPCVAPCAVGYSVESADIDVWSLMFNVYADLGTWRGFTPYVGAGIGGAVVSTDNVRYVNGNGATGSYKGYSQLNLAWALMAGASYEMTPNTMVDFGYQFRSMGQAQSGLVGSGERIKYDDLYAHELRVGLRYNFN